MSTTIRNIIGVAAAVAVLFGFNAIKDSTAPVSDSDSSTITGTSSALTANASGAGASAPASVLTEFNNAIVNIANETNPAVVMITTEKTQEVRVMDPFSQFFGNPFGNRGDRTREYTRRGLGSGVIVSNDGYIITNNHVIDNTDLIKVRLFNNEEMDATLVGADPQTDIAVLKIEGKNFSSVRLGDSDRLQVGSMVLAIGSPLSENLAHTVSFGIVSAKGRNINILSDVAGYEDYIQTDAAINPGNSGGALIDINGELVGINSAIASRSGGNDGIGFAIPINLAKRVMDDIIKDGKVSRGYLGLYFGGEVDKTMAQALGLKDARGIIVARVEEGGPAEKAGVKEKDVIVSIDGKQIRDWNAFRSNIASKRPNDKVKLGIIRSGKARDVTVTLGEQDTNALGVAPSVDTKDIHSKLGFDITGLNSNIRQQLNLKSDVEGVVVSKIEESSNAYRRGLRRGDVVIAVKDRNIKETSDFYDEIEKLAKKGDQVVLLTVLRNDLEQYIAFNL